MFDMCLQALAPLVDRAALVQGVRELRFCGTGRTAWPAPARDGGAFRLVVLDAQRARGDVSGLELTSVT